MTMDEATIAVIDATATDPSVATRWRESGLIAKLHKLGAQPVVLDPQGGDWPDLSVVSSLRGLVGDGEGALVRVEATQLFLDIDIAAAGLARFRNHGGAYFTQWEHCRLPIGIGIRAYDAAMVRGSGAKTFAGLDDYLFANRETLSFLYDDEAHATYQQSLLDSRLVLSNGANEWNLNGFLETSKDTDGLRFEPDVAAGSVDERGMAAAYGFESVACATFPTYVMFDMTNKCNAKCIHCPHSVGFPGSDKPEYIDIEVYKTVIDQCRGKTIDFIRVTADGEPLLHPRIWELLAYAHEQGVGPLGLTSNGSALSEANAGRLMDSKIFMADFSLDAFSEETFELVRRGLSYARTHDNVRRLIEMRNQRNDPLKIMVSFVKQKENAHELDAFKAYWEPLADKVLVREMHTNVGVNDKTDAEGYGEAGRYPCPHLFRRAVADYAGDLKFCPIDWRGGSKLARAADTSIAAAWHGEDYRKHRMQHLNNVFAADSICRDCEDWKSTPWELGYEKVVGELADGKTK